MRTTSHVTRLSARQAAFGLAIAATAGVACSDAAAPVAPPDRPTLAANPTGPLAVESILGLEPLLGASSNQSQAEDIDDLGQVVGWSQAAGVQVHAVLWNPAANPFPQDLGTLAGGMLSAANAINSTGTVIVGSSDSTGVEYAVRWVNVNGAWTIQNLGILPGQTLAQAFDVSDAGAIVGMWRDGAGFRGFLWQNGVMTDLGPAGVERARALNDGGQVVGVNANDHAVLWTAANGAIEIGTLGGSTSFAADINEKGEVAGFAATSSNVDRAFLWTPRKGMVDLGTLGGSFSFGRGINAAGEVVGGSFTAANEERAFLWAKGKMLDLGVLPGYAGSDALAINNQKQVVGVSRNGSSVFRATMWTIK